MAKFDLESTIKKGVEAAINRPVYGGKSITEWAAIGMKAPQWIAVTDRMPEEGTTCLLYADGCIIVGRYIEYDQWLTPGVGKAPTHWMPLPEPPGGKRVHT